MKKIILFIIVFLGIFPVFHHGHVRLINVTHVRADDWGDEDDNNDPPDDPPCDDTGDSYSETPGGSDNCFTYTDWTDVSWDCDGSYEDSGTYSTPITTLDGVSLTLSSYSGNIGDAITLTATASSTGEPGLTYEYQEFDNVDGWIDIETSSSNSSVYIIDQGGESPFRVIVTSDCGGSVTSDEEDFIGSDYSSCTNNSISINWGAENYTTTPDQANSETNLEAFNATYDACFDQANNVWRLVVTSISGNVDIEVNLGGFRDPYLKPPKNFTQARAAVNDMLDQYSRGSTGYWDTEQAIKTHEEYHYSELKCAGNYYWPNIRSCFYNNFTVPYSSYSDKASALDALMALDPNSILIKMYNAAVDYANGVGDSAYDPPYAAGQVVLNAAIIYVQGIATAKGWGVPSGTTFVTVPDPCSFSYSTTVSCP